MISRNFIVEEHSEYGMIGVRPLDMPNADPLGGFGAAHDMLEHFPDDDGTVHAELMALGASFWLRGETGFLGNNYISPEKTISNDFVELFRHVYYESFALPEPPRMRKLDDDIETSIYKIVDEGFDLIREVNQYDIDVDSEEVNHILNREVWAGWLRKGYQKANRRFSRAVCRYSLASMFNDIANGVDKIIKNAEIGDTVKISINLRRLSYTVKHHENWN